MVYGSASLFPVSRGLAEQGCTVWFWRLPRGFESSRILLKPRRWRRECVLRSTEVDATIVTAKWILSGLLGVFGRRFYARWVCASSGAGHLETNMDDTVPRGQQMRGQLALPVHYGVCGYEMKFGLQDSGNSRMALAVAVTRVVAESGESRGRHVRGAAAAGVVNVWPADAQ